MRPAELLPLAAPVQYIPEVKRHNAEILEHNLPSKRLCMAVEDVNVDIDLKLLENNQTSTINSYLCSQPLNKLLLYTEVMEFHKATENVSIYMDAERRV